ncbi:MAG: hypothetical protein M1600_06860 [Firmicutes bacterium]|nr:hypothetical protein [Bacillota bacterium]
MSIQSMGSGVVRCPCSGCGKMIDYTMIHPSATLPKKVRTLCRNLHPVELEFLVQGQEPKTRCLLRTDGAK